MAVYAALNRVMRYPYCEAINARVYNEMQDRLKRPSYDYEFTSHYVWAAFNNNNARMVRLSQDIFNAANGDDYYRMGTLFGEMCDLMFG